MPPKPRKSKEQFEISNKNRLKYNKADIKESLRHNRLSRNLMVESPPQNSDDQEYQQKVVNRGVEWWRKVQHRFFRHMTPEEIAELMRRTTSEELLGMRYPARQMGEYLTECVLGASPALMNPSLVKVLFRREVRLDRLEHYALGVFQLREYQHIRDQPRTAPEKGLHLSTFREPQREMPAESWPLQHLDLDLVKLETNEHDIEALLNNEVRTQEGNEIEMEMKLWEHELKQQNEANLSKWEEVRGRMIQVSEPKEYDYEIADIHKQLRMAQVLLYFKRGHGDKTQEMLEEAQSLAKWKEHSMKEEQRRKPNSKMEQLKGLFETDCKICFCTESDAKNLVVYCDDCNTSFHQACYGLEQITQDKFYCEVCAFVRKNNGHIRKPACQICSKPNFPMKQIKGHFYHITCLVLFGMVEVTDYRIEFKPAFSKNKIFEAIVENELSTGTCDFCTKEGGMKLQCAQQCGKYFHPICGYLNGVHFELDRNYRQLNVRPTCSDHHPDRDTLNQIYLRRFFCDYKGTSNISDADFMKDYERDVKDLAAAKKAKKKEESMGVMRRGRSRLNRTITKPSPLKSRRSDQKLSDPPIKTQVAETRRLYHRSQADRQ